MRTMEFENIYDSAFDLASMHVDSEFSFSKTVEIEDGFLIDFDEGDLPVAVEIISAAKKFGMLPDQLDGSKVTGRIKITRFFIQIEFEMSFAMESSRHFIREVPNFCGICEGEFRLKFR